MKRYALLVAVLGASMVAGSAMACSVSATSVNFGTIDPLIDSETLSTGVISVSCPQSTSYTVDLGPGNGTINSREMVAGIDILSYNLYTDASHSMIWGDGTGGSTTVSGTADSTGTDHTVYGRLPWQPQAPPGSYSDSIVITVSY